MSDTTRLMGTRASRRAACVAVRGKPSRMNEAEGAGDGEGVGGEGVSEVCVGSQFFDFSSARMSRSMVSSGTRFPDFMALSASRPAYGEVVSWWYFLGGGRRDRDGAPREVCLRTLCRRRSPELTAESWGKRFMRRSA